MKYTQDEVQNVARLKRLHALQILDTAPESNFDDIVKIAAALCGTPIALVSLVDENRQWFKAKVGLDIPETPIEQAVCAHALDGPDILEIPDLRQDERTRQNDLVTPDDGIRFYAGAPLKTDGGYALGTLCVIDNQPRPEGLSETQREGLMALGRQVMSLIELRRNLRDRETETAHTRRRNQVYKNLAKRREEEHKKSANEAISHREAQAAGQIGTFEIETGSDMVKVSAEFCRLFWLPEAEEHPVATTISMIHPEDREAASSRETRTSATAIRDVEYRVVRPSDGKVRWISRRASFDYDAQGKPIRMLGTVQDVTERRFAHDRMRHLLELGDRLHIAETIEEAAEAAGEKLRKALDVTRGGYATFDLAGGRVTVEQDSTAPGVDSVKGWRPTFEYPETLEKLREGIPVAIEDVRNLPWMEKEVPGYIAVGAIAQLWIPIKVHGILVGTLFAQNDEPRHWTFDEREFAESVGYRTYMTIAKLQAQADQQLLNQELGHRLKNMLAMIMALATQSLKGASDQVAVETFRKRLMALGAAHEDLLQRSWSGAQIAAIVEGVLDKLAGRERISIEGPDIMLGPRASLALSLIVHELGTNAIKYGALSNETGKVNILWKTEGHGEAERLVLRWTETGGPPASAPFETGFGSQLIELGLMGTGDARLEFKSSGLVAEFSASLQLARQA